MPNTALILIDIQNDYFEDGDWPVNNMAKATDNAARLLTAARARGELVIHIRHEIASDTAPFFRPGSKGAEIHAAVAPKDGEVVILKQLPNSFQGTDLLATLQNANITQLRLCGAMSQMCVHATARAAKDFGFEVIVIHDACAAKDITFDGVTVPAAQVHAAFMGALVGSYAELIATQDLLD